MIEIELNLVRRGLPAASDIKSVAASLGLRIALKGTLAKFPGCTHWHFKRGRERGTLELTVWPRGHRTWLSVQSGRKGEWIDDAAFNMKKGLESLS